MKMAKTHLTYSISDMLYTKVLLSSSFVVNISEILYFVSLQDRKIKLFLQSLK